MTAADDRARADGSTVPVFGVPVPALPDDATPTSVVALVQLDRPGGREWATRWSADLSPAEAAAMLRRRLRDEERRAEREAAAQAGPGRLHRTYSAVASAFWWVLLLAVLVTFAIGVGRFPGGEERILVLGAGIIMAMLGLPQAARHLRSRAAR